jgi:hypothetical protein
VIAEVYWPPCTPVGSSKLSSNWSAGQSSASSSLVAHSAYRFAQHWHVLQQLTRFLKRTLECDPTAGRGVMRATLKTPVKVTPALDAAGQLIGWDYEEHGALDKLLAGPPTG